MVIPEEFKERLKEAAKKSVTIRETLTVLFPEVFPQHYFRAGSVFYLTDNWFVLNSSKPEERITEANKCSVCVINSENIAAPVSRLILLIHEKNAHEYRWVSMDTGYYFTGRRIFTRNSKGIHIPEEALQGIELFSVGYGK